MTTERFKVRCGVVAGVMAAVMSIYSCGLVVESSLVVNPFKFQFRDWACVCPWGLIQLLVFMGFWFLTFQVAARSRVFALCILAPLLLEYVFHSYLAGCYAGVSYATVVESAFCATFEQMGTYASARLFGLWAVVIAVILVYVFFFHKRVWRDRPTRAKGWCAAWVAYVLISYLGISCHGTSIPNARFYLAQYRLDGSVNSCFGEGFAESFTSYARLRENPIYCEITERDRCSDVYLPYSPFITWSRVACRALFPRTVHNSAGYESEMLAKGGKLCVVLYIAESFRADHTPFSGYHRNTLPLVTGRHGGNIIVLPNVISYDTYTIPCLYGILSDADNGHREASISSFMGIFKKHGFHCTMADGSADGAPWSNAPQLKPVLAGSYDDLFIYEAEDMLYDAVRGTLRAHDLNVMVIEDGSGHWPYTEATGDVWGADSIALYDETLLITDRRLHALMEELKDQPAIILFVSDHGESLGEEGRICHGGALSSMEQRRVAAFVWYSDAYAELYPEVIHNLKDNASDFTEQGHIFHTMPTLGGIRSAAQKPEMDMARPQKKTE